MTKFWCSFRNLQTKHKFYLLMSLTVSLMILGSVFFALNSSHRNRLIAELQLKEQRETINTLLRLKSDSYAQILLDYSCYDDMIRFLHTHDTAWSKINITAVPSYKLQLCQVYDLDKQLQFEQKDSLLKQHFAIGEKVFKILDKNKTIEYFAQTEDGILQICGSSIHQSDDLERKSKPYGYFIIVKLWTKDYIQKLEKLSDAKINIQSKQPDKHGDSLIVIGLPSLDKTDAAYLCATKFNPLLKSINRLGVYSTVLVILLSFFVLFTFFVSFRYLIINPLKIIIKSLDETNPSELVYFDQQKDEFGKIASLINDFFMQQSQLYAEIEERKQIQEELGNANEELHAMNEEIETQRNEIIKQRDTIAIENKRFMDSINAASRIQHALIPPESLMHKAVPCNFVFSRPRDVLSGDFHWLRIVRHYVYGAVGDCTGHGVPGAVMSVLGIALLNEATSHGRTETPAEVLNFIRKRLISTLHQKVVRNFSSEGMDIVLCRFDMENNVLEYAGAYNPLFITRLKNTETGEREMIELKADPMPVGIHPKDSHPFTNKIHHLQIGDRLYLTSDGYKTQFGGAKDQKFSSKRFKNMIMDMQDKSMAEQHEILGRILNSWQRGRPQVDDILVIGIEITRPEQKQQSIT